MVLRLCLHIVCHRVVNFDVWTVEHSEGTVAIGHVNGPLTAGETRRDPVKGLDILKTFRRVIQAGHMVRTRYEDVGPV